MKAIIVIFSEQRRATDFVKTADGRAANDILHDARKDLK